MKFLQRALDTNYEVQTESGIEHRKVKHLLLDIFVIGAVLFGIISSFYVASAATFGWTQSSWSGGLNATATTTHNPNGSNITTGWTNYSATSTGVLASSGGVSLAGTSYAFTDDPTGSATSSTPASISTGGGFLNGVTSSTQVTGTAGAASVGLTTNTFSVSTNGTDIHTTVGAYEYYKYTSTTTQGTFTVNSGSRTLEWLAVGGGGSGGFNGSGGGGGGAGGYLTGSEASSVKTYNTSVGEGGAAQSTTGNGGTAGSNTVFDGHTAFGGGRGAGATGSEGGGNGGCGGGAIDDIFVAGAAGGTGSQGGNGGNSFDGSSTNRAAGGGGGATSAGSNGTSGVGGSGGNGTAWSDGITYAGGGGGASQAGSAGSGGTGGGGAAIETGAATAGTDNKGGGGGGARTTGPSGKGGTGVIIIRYLTNEYFHSGTFTSAPINLGVKVAVPTLSWNQTLNGGTIAMQVQTSADNVTWSGYSTITSSGSITIPSAGVQYVQYKATLTASSGNAATPTLNDVTINYNQYAASGNLTSSKYNTNDPTNTISGITWDATTPSGTAVKFQIRASSTEAGLDSAPWCGPNNCSGSDYFTTSGQTVANNPTLTGSTNHQWIQYKTFLTSGGDLTPNLNSVNIQYVVNKAPEFDQSYGPVGNRGVIVSQATSTQANTGKVLINYSVRDSDTTSGTLANRLKVTPSFEYNTGSGWNPITSLATGDTDPKAVLEVGYNTYTAIWDAKTQLGSAINTTSAQVRVTVNDLEGANNLATATSSAFILDTTPPQVSFKLNGTDNTITLNATDTNQLYYYGISNNPNFGTLGTSGSPTASTTSVANFPWTFDYTTSSSSVTVYSEVTDIYGNTASTTAVAPHFSESIAITDLSNSNTNQYREFLAWPVYPVADGLGANFLKYELYRSVNNENNFTLLSPDSVNSFTNSMLNFYTNSSLASSTVYYYKVRFVDTDGDISNYSNIVWDKADGQGGTDVVKPTISNATSTNIKNTSATITFNTDELADSRVESVGSPLFTTRSVASYLLTGHSVTLSGLSPNITYTYKIFAKDTSNNEGTSQLPEYTFTTAGGPVISDVKPSALDGSGTKATITWTTNTNSNSVVKYGTDSTLQTVASVGGNANTTAHTVSLTNLSPSATYYYSVSSTDGQSNTTEDNNSGSGYLLKTGQDSQAPTITSPSVIRYVTSAIITWDTDKLADSEVKYGREAGLISGTTVNVNTPTILHSLTLSSQTNNLLAASTTYYYTIKSTGQNGIATTTAESSFTTLADTESNLQSQVTSLTAQVNAKPQAGGGGGGGGPSVAVDSTPAIISDIKVEKITAFGAEVSFTTNELTRGLVEYGMDTKYGANTGDKIFATKHVISLKGLQLGTEYHFTVDTIDKAGNISNSEDKSFKTEFIAQDLGALATLGDSFNSVQDKLESLISSALPSLNPPFISKPEVINAEQETAEIDFSTNVKAYGSVQYATDEEWSKEQKYTGEVADTDNKTNAHKFNLTNLKPGTKYHYTVRSYVFTGAMAKTDDATFLTKAGNVEARITDKKKDSFRVVWTTDKPTTSVVEYKKSGGKSAERKTDLTLNTYHDVLLDKLTPNTTYIVKAYGDDENDNRISAKAELTVTTSQDVTPPTISNFKIESTLVPGRADKIQTLISWKTDEPATTVVYYGESAGSSKDVLPNKQEDTSTLTTNHTMIITNLKPGAIYRLQVASKDDAENEAKTPMRTIITPKQSESIVDVIFSNFDSTFQFMNNIKR